MRILVVGAALAAVVAAMLPGVAAADVAAGKPEFNWTQPTTWSDGSVLSVSQITGYQVNCGAGLSTRVAPAAAIPPWLWSGTALAPGDYQCTVAVFAKKTATTAEVLGEASAPVSFTVPQPKPNAPTGVSVR